MSQRRQRVVASVAVAVAIAAATFLTRAWAVTATPSPGTCAPVNPIVTESVQFVDEQCRISVYGPTTGHCQMYLLQGVPVLDCPGVALQKFTMAAWP